MSARHHIYGTVNCDCEACAGARKIAADAGPGWISAGIAALAAAQGHYPASTREWLALERARRPLEKLLDYLEKHKGPTQ